MDERELDSLMEAGLASYSAEPDAGLAGKIVAEVGFPPAQVRPLFQTRWWRGTVGIAAAGLMAAFVFGHAGRWAVQPVHLSASDQTTASSPKELAPEVDAHLERATSKMRRAAAKNGASRTVYTQPPMTAQEQRLVFLATYHPEALRAFVRTDEDMTESKPLRIQQLSDSPLTSAPLEIEAIKTEPLSIEDGK